MATRSRVDAVLRKRLRDGSLAVGVEPPVDACVRELAAFRKTLLSSGTGDTSPADRQQACQAACDDFCQALDVLDFHVRRTRHAGHIVSAETASLHALQSKIAELQELARTEIAALKLDLKAAYQTHLNKEEYEASAVRVNRFKSRAAYTARIASLEGELDTLAGQHSSREAQLEKRRRECQGLLEAIQALKKSLKEEDAAAAAKRKAARAGGGHVGGAGGDDDDDDDDDEDDEDDEEDGADANPKARARRGIDSGDEEDPHAKDEEDGAGSAGEDIGESGAER